MATKAIKPLSYFQIVKTPKTIDEIKDKVSDRLIITKSGKMYFDYSNTERIEIATNVAPYLLDTSTCLSFQNNNVWDELPFLSKQIKDCYGNDLEINQIVQYALIFDKFGNYGLIRDISKTNGIVKVLILGITNSKVENIINEKLDGNIVGNFIVTKNEEPPFKDRYDGTREELKITVQQANIENGEVTNSNIIFASEQGLFNLSLSDNPDAKIVNMTLQISPDPNNILEVKTNGLFVPKSNGGDPSGNYVTQDEFDELKNTINHDFDNINTTIGSIENDITNIQESIPENLDETISNIEHDIKQLNERINEFKPVDFNLSYDSYDDLYNHLGDLNPGIIYLVPNKDNPDVYDSYIASYKDGVKVLVPFGNVNIDTSNFYTKSEIDEKFNFVNNTFATKAEVSRITPTDIYTTLQDIPSEKLLKGQMYAIGTEQIGYTTYVFIGEDETGKKFRQINTTTEIIVIV